MARVFRYSETIRPWLSFFAAIIGVIEKCDVKGAEFYPHTNCEYTFDENRHNTSFVNFKGSKVKKKNHTEQTLLLFLYQREEIASVYF